MWTSPILYLTFINRLQLKKKLPIRHLWGLKIYIGRQRWPWPWPFFRVDRNYFKEVSFTPFIDLMQMGLWKKLLNCPPLFYHFMYVLSIFFCMKHKFCHQLPVEKIYFELTIEADNHKWWSREKRQSIQSRWLFRLHRSKFGRDIGQWYRVVYAKGQHKGQERE